MAARACGPNRPNGDVQVDRAQKKELVATLHDTLSRTAVVVVAHYSGLTVAQMTMLRRQMKQAGGQVRVAKNRLVKLALEGTEKTAMADLLTGPTCLAYSDDPVIAPKILVDFAKGNDKLVILGGVMGAKALDPEGVKSLASLPSLDELRARIVGLVQAPAAKIARTIKEPGAQLARVLAARGAESEAA